METPLSILKEMMAARETYRANLTALGYSRVVVERFDNSWTGWVHPNYIHIVNKVIEEHYCIDMEDIEKATGHPLPEDAVLPDFWLAHPTDMRPGRDIIGHTTED